jgi:hypothetical protein
MKTIKLLQCVTLFTTVIVGSCFDAAAQATVSVHRTGAANIYKGSCSYNTTTFTVTAYNNYTGVEVYVYIGGQGNGQNSDDIDSCWAASQHNGGDTVPDFYVSGTGLSQFPYVPHLYELVIPAFQGSATITVTTTNSASRCSDPYSTVLVSLPADEQYTEDEYEVDPEAASDTANLYPVTPITVSVQFNNYPPNLYKSSQNSISFTLTASSPVPGNTQVVFFVGGDGTAFTSSDPCYAVASTDFSVSGCSTAPFPNGFYVNFGQGDTTKTITLTAVDSESDCEEDYQTLLVTIPSNGACAGYSPGSPAQATGYVYP